MSLFTAFLCLGAIVLCGARMVALRNNHKLFHRIALGASILMAFAAIGLVREVVGGNWQAVHTATGGAVAAAVGLGASRYGFRAARVALFGVSVLALGLAALVVAINASPTPSISGNTSASAVMFHIGGAALIAQAFVLALAAAALGLKSTMTATGARLALAMVGIGVALAIWYFYGGPALDGGYLPLVDASGSATEIQAQVQVQEAARTKVKWIAAPAVLIDGAKGLGHALLVIAGCFVTAATLGELVRPLRSALYLCAGLASATVFCGVLTLIGPHSAPSPELMTIWLGHFGVDPELIVGTPKLVNDDALFVRVWDVAPLLVGLMVASVCGALAGVGGLGKAKSRVEALTALAAGRDLLMLAALLAFVATALLWMGNFEAVGRYVPSARALAPLALGFTLAAAVPAWRAAVGHRNPALRRLWFALPAVGAVVAVFVGLSLSPGGVVLQ